MTILLVNTEVTQMDDRNAVAYVRVSSERQRNNFSLEAQRQAIRTYAQRHKLTVVTTFQDVKSGKNIERPGLEQALAFLASGAASMLVVYKLNRISRNVSDMLNVFEQCAGLEVDIVSVTEADLTSGSSATGKLQVSLLAIAGQLERAMITENQRSAYNAKYAQGKLLSASVPFGYCWNPLHQRAVIRPNDALMVKQTFELYLAGFGYRRISKNLADRWQRKISPVVVRNILTNKRYIGVVENRFGTKEAMLPPIIDLNQFDEVQRVMAGRRTVRSDRPLWLKRRIVCPTCGNHRLYTAQTGDYYYYECRKPGGYRIPALSIEHEVLEILDHWVKQTLKNKHKNAVKRSGISESTLLQMYEVGQLSSLDLVTQLTQISTHPKVGLSVGFKRAIAIRKMILGPHDFEHLRPLNSLIDHVKVVQQDGSIRGVYLVDDPTVNIKIKGT